MEALELHFNWSNWFQPHLHSLALFFSSIARCNRFNKCCIRDNPRIEDSCLENMMAVAVAGVVTSVL